MEITCAHEGKGDLDEMHSSPKGVDLLDDLLFAAGLVIWLVWRILSSSLFALPNGSPVNTLLHFGSLALMALSVVVGLLRGFDKSSIVLGTVLFAVGALSYVASGLAILADLSIIVCAGARHDLRWVFRIAFWSTLVCVLLIVISSLVGIIENVPFLRGDGSVRYGLGFLYCTYLSHYYLNLVLVYFFLRGEGVTVWECLAIIVGDVAIYIATDSRTSFLLVVLFIVLTLAIRRDVVRRLMDASAFKGLASCTFVICAAVCLAATIAYDDTSEVWRSVNGALSNRLEQTQTALSTYGVPLMGQEITFLGNGLVMTSEGAVVDEQVMPDGDPNFIDSSFVNLLVVHGIIPFALIVAMATAACIVAVKQQERILQTILIVVALHAMVDTQLIEPQYNTFLILMFSCAATVLDSKMRGPMGQTNHSAE